MMDGFDYFHLQFAAGESASQGFVSAGAALHQGARRMDEALAMLYDSGLQGTFLAAFENRLAELLNALQTLADEAEKTGGYLQMVVERARLLDVQTALRWMQGSEVFLPDSGGGPGHLADVGTSVTRLEALQVGLYAQLADVQRQKNNPVNMLLGLRDDYEAMEGQLTNTMARNAARIDQLRLEQQTLEQEVSASESGFGQLIRDHEKATMVEAPQSYAVFVHRQYNTGDTYGCALYAQSSVLEAMGYDFTETLNASRKEGIAEGWYDVSTTDGDRTMGTEYWGLGDVFESNGIPYDKMGGTQEWSGSVPPGQDTALERLHSELQQGHFPVVSFQAADVAMYDGQNVKGHTFWVTGMETDAQGQVKSIIANDSHFGRQVIVPVDQFAQGWSKYNYQAVFASQPES